MLILQSKLVFQLIINLSPLYKKGDLCFNIYCNKNVLISFLYRIYSVLDKVGLLHKSKAVFLSQNTG